LEQSQSQLHKTAGELERWRFQQSAVKNTDENSLGSLVCLSQPR